jgi:glycosyltransferase involved in cell wall biosynthesis
MPTLSIVIPAYNEAASIASLLEKILKVPVESLGFEKELIVVDDGSKDATAAIARGFPQVKVFTQVPNQGKGRAVQRGIRESSGDFVLVQDADLEYDPDDYLPLLRALGPRADSVYGSRTLGQARAHPGLSLTPGRHPEQHFGPWLAGALLSLWTLLLYGKWITDTLTAYKLYPAAAVKAMRVKTNGFETDHEITAKLIKQGLRIVEVPISYFPRGVEAGKKIRPRDGFIAVWTLLRFRFTN